MLVEIFRENAEFGRRFFKFLLKYEGKAFDAKEFVDRDIIFEIRNLIYS
jgi:hypothetical protein